ncbi:multiple inositol polyphosphate phosphatase 1-like [Ostrinia nubilalis]|uniref:multiple inositol polyphosphate phosphatase 1-like n=1 Tax=Ostrinia nubilalis TaxID=29057 RepID=UPI0030824A67
MIHLPSVVEKNMMMSHALVILVLVNIAISQSCYWNDGCAYQLFSSKTPYDTVRGDIRDYPTPANCEAVALWSLNRHGNRNPGNSATASMRAIAQLQDEIVSSHYEGKGQLCAQDIEDIKRWRWNETLDESASFLTGVGYEELYEIGKRLREKYPHLAEGTEDDYYFRTTYEQRTITSAMAFVHGWTEGSQINPSVDGPWEHDDVIRPYENCDRYQQDVKGGQAVVDQLEDYFNNPEFINVKNNVQTRLGISTQLSSEDVHSLYELCRFYRSWEPKLKSPWCAAFSNEDLLVVEYRDDVTHYHRNGYGSWVRGTT